MKSREERVARNEELFQEVNRQIEKLEESLGQPETLTILCECSKKHCLDAFEVESAVYARVSMRVRTRPFGVLAAASFLPLALGKSDYWPAFSSSTGKVM